MEFQFVILLGLERLFSNNEKWEEARVRTNINLPSLFTFEVRVLQTYESYIF